MRPEAEQAVVALTAADAGFWVAAGARRGLGLRGSRSARTRSAGAGGVENLLQFLTIYLRRVRRRDAVFIGNDICVRTLAHLLFIRRQFEISEVLLVRLGARRPLRLAEA